MHLFLCIRFSTYLFVFLKVFCHFWAFSTFPPVSFFQLLSISLSTFIPIFLLFCQSLCISTSLAAFLPVCLPFCQYFSLSNSLSAILPLYQSHWPFYLYFRPAICTFYLHLFSSTLCHVFFYSRSCSLNFFISFSAFLPLPLC